MLKKKEKLREIPTKNYLILLVIFIATFSLVYYLFRWYKVYSDYQNDIPVIRDSLPEISNEEMDHYIEENQTTVIYMCTASDTECRTFEKSFKKLIEKKSLKEYITYVNLTNTDLNNFTTNFNNNYKYKKTLTSTYPALVVFTDGEITDMIEATDKEKLSITEVDKFLKENKIGE